MAMVFQTLNKTDVPSVEQLTEIENASKMPITFDEDCPELTDDQLLEVAALAKKQREEQKKDVLSLRVSKKTIDKAKKLGKGYTSILSKVLEFAFNNDEILKNAMVL